MSSTEHNLAPNVYITSIFNVISPEQSFHVQTHSQERPLYYLLGSRSALPLAKVSLVGEGEMIKSINK